jgi:hypothetical protein
MPQDGEQSQQKRRTRATTDAQGPAPLVYPNKSEGRSTSSMPLTHTDGYTGDDGLLEPPRPGTSVVRYTNQQGPHPNRTTSAQPISPSIPLRRQQGTTKNFPERQPRATAHHLDMPKIQARKSVHWLLPVGIGMLAMLVLWMLGSSVLAWGIQRYYDVHYGYPRTFQTDQAVGHGGDSSTHPSHFIAVNLHRQAVVYEIMAGDPSKSVSYVAPVYIEGDGGDLAPITLEFRDVTGDGKQDMIIHIHLPSQDQISVFVNDGTKFRPSGGNDKIHI